MPRMLWIVTLSAAVLLGMAACGARSLSANTGGAHAATQEPTITPWPTATPKPFPPTPTNFPAGWQVYALAGGHFSIAYPAGAFTTRQTTEANSTPSQPAITYIFDATNAEMVDGTGMPIEL